MPKSRFLDYTEGIFLSVLCFFLLIATNAPVEAAGGLHAFILSSPDVIHETFRHDPEKEAVFKGAGGKKLFIARTFPDGYKINPPDRLRFDARALPYNRRVLLLLEPPNLPDIEAYKIYASVNRPGGGGGDYYFELASILREHEIDFKHEGLTNFIEYSYIVTALDEEGGEYAVSSRIACAVPGTSERGYLDEAARR